MPGIKVMIARALDLYRLAIAYSGMTLMGLVMTILRFCIPRYGVAINRRWIAPFCCRAMLLMVGVRVKNDIQPSQLIQIYMFNHNSFLDIFIVPMLGLENTRFIISEATRSILPLHLCNLGIDVLYIPPKGDPDRRLAFFKRVTTQLKNGEFSVICSPEGQHTFRHGISAFNRGVFHMTVASKRPIQTLFFNIPKSANPLESPRLRPCEVKIEVKELIRTTDWRLDNLDLKIDETREKFINYYFETYGELDETPDVSFSNRSTAAF